MTPYDVFIGRGSALGNPIDFHGSNHRQVTRHVATRAEAISEYEVFLKQKIAEKDPDICEALNQIYQMAKKGDVYLICYCFPLACHGEVIKKIVEEKLAKQGKSY